MAEQPKSQTKKIINPLEGRNSPPAEMSLDFSRPPTPTSRAMEDIDLPEEGEFSQEQPLYALQQVTAIKYRKVEHPNRRIHVWLGILILVLTLAGLVIALPLYLIKTDPTMNLATRNTLRMIQKNLDKRGLGAKTKEYTDLLLLKLKAPESPGTDKAASRAWRDMDCKFLVQEALSRRYKGSLEPNGQYLLTNCQVYQDLPQAALRMISENHGDASQFQRTSDSWEMLPLQLLAGEAQRRLQAFQLVAPKNFTNCRRWSGSPGCLLKFLDQARQPVRTRLDDGYLVLRDALRAQRPVLQAWLGFAAGWNAIKAGDSVQAEQYLWDAAKLFPDLFDPFLEREIFRLRLHNAYRQHDKKLFSVVWKARPLALMSDDDAGFFDAQFYKTLVMKPEKTGSALEEFLSHPESFQRFRYDPVFVRLIVEQSIRFQKSESGLSYLDRIAEQQDEEKALDGESLPLLRARLLIAHQNGQEALQSLQTVEKFAVKSQELAHLKGLAMLQAYSTRPYLLLAAAEFQKAANLEPRSEHFFALIVTFLETKEPKKAETALKFWQKLKGRAADELWRGFAHGLILANQGNEAEARQLWVDLAQRNPGFEPLQRLRANLNEDPKYLQDQLVKRLLPVLPIDGPLSPLVVF